MLRTRLTRYFLKRLGPRSPHDADDLASEVIARAIAVERDGNHRQPIDHVAWGIAHHVWIDHLRARGRRREEPFDDLVAERSDPDAELRVRAERLAFMAHETFLRTAPECARLHDLRMAGLPWEDVGSALGKAENAVKTAYSRCLSRLRSHLRDLGFESSEDL